MKTLLLSKEISLQNDIWPVKIVISCLFILLVTPWLLLGEGKVKTWEEKYSDELYIYELVEENIEINKDWTSEKKIHYIINIQKEGAKDTGIGEIKLDYNRDYEVLTDIKALVINKDGQKLKYKTIQDLAPYSGEPMYSSNRIKVITMPEVVPGNKIDYEVKWHTKKPCIPHTFCTNFSVSMPVPVKMIRYQLKIPKDMPLQIQNQNSDLKPRIENNGKSLIYTWEKENNEKFEFEEYLPALADIWEEIQISSLKDWKEIDSWYGGLVNKNLKVSNILKAQVQELIAGQTTDQDKAQAIIKYIQNNVRYISMSFGEYNYEPHPAAEVYLNKYGDCKDQTILAITMLKEAGITAYPCLFRNESDGSISGKLPMPLYFGHVILGIVLEEKIVYTDLLFKGYRLGDTPMDMQGAYLFVINGQGGLFASLPILAEKENTIITEADINLRRNGSALIVQEKQYNNSVSVSLIQRWKDYTEKEKREFLQRIEEQSAPGGKIIENKFENIDKEYSLIKHIIKCEVPKWAEVSGDYMSFNMGIIERSEQFTKKERTHSLWFQTNFVTSNVYDYHVPAGYHIVSVPEDKQLSSPFLDFTRSYLRNGNDIKEREIMRYKRALLPVTDYEKVQDIFERLPQMTKEKIIIEKDKEFNKKH